MIIIVSSLLHRRRKGLGHFDISVSPTKGLSEDRVEEDLLHLVFNVNFAGDLNPPLASNTRPSLLTVLTQVDLFDDAIQSNIIIIMRDC